jgi:hypothetical protein
MNLYIIVEILDDNWCTVEHIKEERAYHTRSEAEERIKELENGTTRKFHIAWIEI